jgi:hypothetical protein
MSARYQNKIIMPTGPLEGPVGLLNLTPDERKNETRWHQKEWHAFIEELRAYRRKVGTAVYDANMRLWEKAKNCPKCAARRRAILQAMQNFKGPKSQRGSIILSMAAGDPAPDDCGFTASTIPNLNRFVIEPTNSFTGAQLNGDGDWYHNVGGTINFGSSRGTWASDCAIADYDTRWNQNSGNTLTGSSGSDGVWSAGTSTKEVYYYITNIGLLAGSFDMECRDGSTLTLLFTDAFSMSCEVDARN